MARQREESFHMRRAWVWGADAEWRWRRALRLLLEAGMAEPTAEPGQEEEEGHEGGGLCAGLDRAAGRATHD
jgi:hypothetical protein